MQIDLKSNEIIEIGTLLINNFENVKDNAKLSKFIYRYVANYYISTIKHNVECVIEYDEDKLDYCNLFNLIKDDYNFFFNENVKIKEKHIKIRIGGQDE